jgi:hypothetical protein
MTALAWKTMIPWHLEIDNSLEMQIINKYSHAGCHQIQDIRKGHIPLQQAS